MQRKWRRVWEHRQGSRSTAQAKNSGGSLKSLVRTILPPVTAATMLLSSMIMPAYANPTGGQITAGTGSIAQTGNTMNITQNTNKLSINWQSFNIAKNETVNFQQPGASAIALNRVVGNNASSIYGHLNANGQVFLINTNGVLFAPGSAVKVGGLVASTLNISDRDFQNGNYKFSGTGGSVVNQGAITATDGGYVALLGNQVSNQGVIVANEGTVALGAGNAVTLDFAGDGLYSLAVDEAALNAQASNQNLIQANGGQVYMTARAANALAGSVLNNSGVIEAQTINNKNGVVILDGGPTGAVVNSGTLDASGRSAGQTGGTVNVLGDNLTLTAGTKIDVSGANGGGTALIGGNAHGQGSEQNATTTTVAKGATISADALTYGNGGKVVIWSDGVTNFAGMISAQGGSVSGDGGRVETSGKKLTIADSALVTTLAARGQAGNWLLDPDGFTIGLNADMTGAALSNALANGNVEIASTSGSGTDGNINVNDAVTWAANTLTLTATNNIFVNGVMTASGTAGLAANYGHVLDANGNPTAMVTPGQDANHTPGTNADGTPMGLYTDQGATSGAFAGKVNFSGTGGVTLNGTNYTVVNELAELAAAKNDPAGHYVLGSDIYGLTATSWEGALADTTAFTGAFNGFGHLVVLPELTGSGLFGIIGGGAVVSNLGITAATVNAGSTSKPAAGILANVNQGSIINSFADGELKNTNIDSAGGLVGDNFGLIAQSYFQGKVFATKIAGGLVGTNEAGGRIIESAVRGPISNYHQITNLADAARIEYVGGLVGVNEGDIDRSYASNVIRLTDSHSIAGGLVGKNTGTIDESYASASDYSTGPCLAGFVGENSGTITNAYTTFLYNTSPAANWIAGFAYQNSGTIQNAYATAYAAGSTQRYGFIYDNSGGTAANGYWYANKGDTTPALQDNSPAMSLDAVQAATFSSYAGFSSPFWGESRSGYPILRNIPVYVSTNTNAPTYGFAPYGVYTFLSLMRLSVTGLQGGGGDSSLMDSIKKVSSTAYYPFEAVTDNGYVNAGTQAAANVLLSSAYSNIKGTVTVKPQTLTLAAEAVGNKTYDGTMAAALATPTLTGYVGTQTLAINYTGAAFADKNAGTDKTVNLTYTAADGANGGKVGNYVIPDTTTAAIAQKEITTSDITAVDKVYDGTRVAMVSYQLPGMVAGDDLFLSYSALFDDKNAGQDKTVSISGLTIGGADSANYTLQNASSLATKANITPRALELYGSKQPDGSIIFPAASLYLPNVVPGDAVSLTGSVTLASANAGVQAITDMSGLTVNNANYTLTGASGAITIGQVSLALDQVVGGDSTATISPAGKTTTIDQYIDKAVIDWYRFSLAADETLTFNQPHSYSIVLNRVTGNEQSIINGSLNANGRVFIINANGVLFAAGSRVNVGALAASTQGMSDSDFTNGNYVFTAVGGSGSVIAAGDIVIVDQGFLALVSSGGVTNSGSVKFQEDGSGSGKVVLAAANQLTLTLNPADSGLTNYAIAGLQGTTTMEGVVNLGNGGFLETAGATVFRGSDSYVAGNNGTWSWTTPSITVGSGSLTPSFLQNYLAGGFNISLNALGGDLTVNDAVAWSGDATLSLNAANNINLNQSLTATGPNAGLIMNYGGDYRIDMTRGGSVTLKGANAILNINGDAYRLIHSMRDLEAIDDNAASTAAGYYALAQDLDAAGTIYDYNAALVPRTGGSGALINTLSGTLAGLGHTISNLTISSTVGHTGLIGTVEEGSVVRDIGLLNVNINASGVKSTGSLAAWSMGTISNAYATGMVTSQDTGPYSGDYTGGLIGHAEGNIINSHADVAVAGASQVGGLVGDGLGCDITGSYATGRVTGGDTVGGLVGNFYQGTITDCYATGAVTGSDYWTGGLVGNLNSKSYIHDSYATGAVTGDTCVGGLVGDIETGGNVDNCYALGDVTGKAGVGGLAGTVGFKGGNNPFSIRNSYAAGHVTGENQIGGLVGSNQGYLLDSYATGRVTGLDANGAIGGLVGLNDFIGSYDSEISNCYATGDVENLAQFATQGRTGGTGGLVGLSRGRVYPTTKPPRYTKAIITDSYATGNVTVAANWHSDWGAVGALVGNNSGVIDNSHATGSINGPDLPNVARDLVGSNTVPDSIVNIPNNITNSNYHDVVAETAAAQQTAAEDAVGQSAAIQQTAEQAGSGPQTYSGRPASRTRGDTLQNLANLLNPANLFQSTANDQLVYSDLGSSYSAHIKSIFANGVEYQLEDNDFNGEDNSAK